MTQDFEEQMRESKENIDNDDCTDSNLCSRRTFMGMLLASLGGIAAVIMAIPFVRSLWPDAGVLASGTLEVDISNIKAGESITVLWRGKPVSITHRTSEQIQEAKAVNLSELKDPQPDADRVKAGKEQWLVTIAICTHLGCVPIMGKGTYSGALCPCHGSQYDTSGRIRIGPAPTNLAIPPYKFISDTKILIG